MKEDNVSIPTSDGVSEGILYHPDGDGPWPGVIHLTDIGGIRPAHEEMAARLAGEGYVVLLPNIFYRSRKPPMFDFPMDFGEERTKKRFAEIAGPMTPEVMERDGASYVDFLAAQPGVAPGSMGVVGYCISGAFALRTAAVRPDKIAAAASFHGGGLWSDKPSSPHLILPKIKARLYIGYATEDHSMPPEAIENFDAALEAWGGDYESEIYDGAHHGWTASDRPVYNPEQAERAFEELTELFAIALV